MIKIKYDDINLSSGKHIDKLLKKLVLEIKSDSLLFDVFKNEVGDVNESLVISILVDPLEDIELPLILKLKHLVDYSRHLIEYDKLRPIGGSRTEAKEYRLKHMSEALKLAGLIGSNTEQSVMDSLATLLTNNTNTLIKKLYSDLSKKLNIDKKESFEIIKHFKPVFNYDKITSDYRHDLLAGLSIKACPYCNRQYVTTYNYNSKKTATADLDHFYPKSFYPFYALSLYNFVPSCQICNSRLKGNKVYGIIYPYKESFDKDGMFELEYPSAMSLIGEDEPNITITIKENERSFRIENSIKLFRLEELYEDHTDLAREIVFKKEIYDRLINSEINRILGNHGVSVTNDQFLQAYYGNYLKEDSLSKRPLSKLTQDILKGFG